MNLERDDEFGAGVFGVDGVELRVPESWGQGAGWGAWHEVFLTRCGRQSTLGS